MVLKHLGGVLLLVLLFAGCTATPARRVERTLDVQRPAAATTLYVVPFAAVLAPEELTSAIFDRFVDGFDVAAAGSGLTASILKRDPATIDSTWLERQYYVTGELFAYREDAGCCSTDLRLRARLQLHQPGTVYPVVRIEIPYAVLFDHDRSDLEAEKERLIEHLSTQLRSALLAEIAPR